MPTIQFIENNFSKYYTTKELSWETLCEAVASPITTFKSKDNVSLWTFAVAVARPELDIATRQPRRISSNFTGSFAIVAEWDDGTTFDSIKEMFANVKHLMYTTWSHGPHINKFRLILPLARPISKDTLTHHLAKKWLLSALPGCDESCLQSYHLQKIPACDPNRRHEYRFDIQREGSYFEIPESITNEVVTRLANKDKWYYKSFRELAPPAPIIEGQDKGKIFDMKMCENDWHSAGNRNNTLFGLCSWAKTKLGLSAYEISQVAARHIPRDMANELTTIINRL